MVRLQLPNFIFALHPGSHSKRTIYAYFIWSMFNNNNYEESSKMNLGLHRLTNWTKQTAWFTWSNES